MGEIILAYAIAGVLLFPTVYGAVIVLSTIL